MANQPVDFKKVKKEYGIDQTENTVTRWVNAARQERDDALEVAALLKQQRDGWKGIANGLLRTSLD